MKEPRDPSNRRAPFLDTKPIMPDSIEVDEDKPKLANKKRPAL